LPLACFTPPHHGSQASLCAGAGGATSFLLQTPPRLPTAKTLALEFEMDATAPFDLSDAVSIPHCASRPMREISPLTRIFSLLSLSSLFFPSSSVPSRSPGTNPSSRSASGSPAVVCCRRSSWPLGWQLADTLATSSTAQRFAEAVLRALTSSASPPSSCSISVFESFISSVADMDELGLGDRDHTGLPSDLPVEVGLQHSTLLLAASSAAAAGPVPDLDHFLHLRTRANGVCWPQFKTSFRSELAAPGAPQPCALVPLSSAESDRVQALLPLVAFSGGARQSAADIGDMLSFPSAAGTRAATAHSAQFLGLGVSLEALGLGGSRSKSRSRTCSRSHVDLEIGIRRTSRSQSLIL